MRSWYITFRSVTTAQRGESVLRRSGIDCVLQRTPRWMEERGCGYCLLLRQREVAGAVKLLKSNGVMLSKVYRQLENGRVEEAEL